MGNSNKGDTKLLSPQFRSKASTLRLLDGIPHLDLQIAEARNNLLAWISGLTTNSIQIFGLKAQPEGLPLEFLTLQPNSISCQAFVVHLHSDFVHFRLLADQSLIDRLMNAYLPGWENEDSEILSDPILVATFLWKKLSCSNALLSEWFEVKQAESQVEPDGYADPFCLSGVIEASGKKYQWGILVDSANKSKIPLSFQHRSCSVWQDLPCRLRLGLERKLFVHELQDLKKDAVLILSSDRRRRLTLYGRAGQLGAWQFQASVDNLQKLLCCSAAFQNLISHNPKRIVHSVTAAQVDNENHQRRRQDSMGNDFDEEIEPNLKAPKDLQESKRPDTELELESHEASTPEPDLGGREQQTSVDADTVSTLELDFSTVRISLDIELGQVDFTLVQLSEIREGTVLETELDLSAPLTVKMDGRPIGTGELVLIGEALGLHIISWPKKSFT